MLATVAVTQLGGIHPRPLLMDDLTEVHHLLPKLCGFLRLSLKLLQEGLSTHDVHKGGEFVVLCMSEDTFFCTVHTLLYKAVHFSRNGRPHIVNCLTMVFELL